MREEVDRMEIDGDHVELPLLPETSPTVLKLPLPSESVASSAGRPAPPRQVGGPEYEAMHLNKKICVSILLPLKSYFLTVTPNLVCHGCAACGTRSSDIDMEVRTANIN